MFDPYHDWLGIPPSEQPPTPHRLLGLPAGETRPATIDEAALRLTAKVRRYQTGPRGDAATRLLNEIAQAQVALTAPARRAAATAPAAGGAPQPAPPAARPDAPPKPADPIPAPAPETDTIPPTAGRPAATPFRPLVVAASVLVVVLVTGGVAAWQFGGPEPDPVAVAAVPAPEEPQATPEPPASAAESPVESPPAARSDDRPATETAPAVVTKSAEPVVRPMSISPPTTVRVSEVTPPTAPTRSILDRLAGTTWVNTNKIRFEWRSDGAFVHGKTPRVCREVGPHSVEIDFGNGHHDKLVFDRDLTRFDQYSSSAGGRLVFTGRQAVSGDFTAPPPPPSEKPRPRRVAVWKVVHPGDVLLTTDQDEVKRLSKAFPGEFKGDKGHFAGVIGYGFAEPQPNTRPLHRYLNTKTDRHVISLDEIRNFLHKEEKFQLRVWVPDKGTPGASARFKFARQKGPGEEYGTFKDKDFFAKAGYPTMQLLCHLFDGP